MNPKVDTTSRSGGGNSSGRGGSTVLPLHQRASTTRPVRSRHRSAFRPSLAMIAAERRTSSSVWTTLGSSTWYSCSVVTTGQRTGAARRTAASVSKNECTWSWMWTRSGRSPRSTAQATRRPERDHVWLARTIR